MTYKLFLISALCLFLSSCKKDDTTPAFDMTFRQEFTIQPGLSVFSTHHYYLKNLPTFYGQLLSDNNKTDAQITRIEPTQINLSAVFGDANFDFIEEASIRVYLESDPSDYLEFAYRFPVPLETGNNLGLIPGLANVKRFLSQDRYSVDISLRLRDTPTEEIPTRLDWIFKAKY
jgi:hypothetical protein